MTSRCLGLIFISLWAAIPLSAASPPSKEEIAATAAWFDGLEWPDISGKPYVEIILGDDRLGSEVVEGPKIRGFLLAEDDQSLTVFGDGTVSQEGSFGRGGWPFVKHRILKNQQAFFAESRVAKREISLGDAVKDLQTELHRPKDEDNERWAGFGRKTSERTAIFVLARCCAKLGRADLAEQLDSEIFALKASSTKQEQNLPFREVIEKEIGHVLMWKAVVDFGDAGVTRPELLAQFERIVREFPASEHRERASGFVEMLRMMISEDEDHARKGKALQEMSANEKVAELLFRLRDQNGHQWSQPGSCEIFNDFGPADAQNSPAHELVKLGYTAVPALIDALSDKRLSRSVGFHRDFYFSHFVLTVGDCAEAILSRIAARSFWTARSSSAAMQKDGETEATRTAVEAWWKGAQTKGEKQMLIEGVQSGGDDCTEQARRLIDIDTAAALNAISAGIQASKRNWTRARLVELIAEIKTADAERALQREMKRCESLHGRVASARELFRRGKMETVGAMIAEWRRWRPREPKMMPSVDDPESSDPLIAFLSTCGDSSAMKALADRFAAVPIDVRFQILEEATENGMSFNRARDENAPLSPEVEALAERLAATALDDRSVRYGMSGSRDDVSYRNPRVCDFAAHFLAMRWPQKYQFKWLPTRLQNDPQVEQIRNAWRAANGLQPLPISRRAPYDAAAGQPNVISSLQWIGGAPLAGTRIIAGQSLTADDVVETIALLHRGLPKGMAGFDFCAERSDDGRGFVVEIQWVSLPGDSSGGGTDICLGDKSLWNSSGGGSADASRYADEKRVLEKALSADASLPISVTFSSRISRK